METYIVKIIRRCEEGDEIVLAGILEDAVTGRTEQFSGADGLVALLETTENKKSRSRTAAKKRGLGPVKCNE